MRQVSFTLPMKGKLIEFELVLFLLDLVLFNSMLLIYATVITLSTRGTVCSGQWYLCLLEKPDTMLRLLLVYD